MDSNVQQPRLLCITTHGKAALGLMRGQLATVRERGFDVTVVASPSWELDAVTEREAVPTISVPMNREITPLQDLVALYRLVRVMKNVRPDIVNAGTPKAGLLGMLAARIANVPARIYVLRGLRLETTSGLKRLLLKTTERIASACAHQVVCVSESMRQVYVEQKLAPAWKCMIPGPGSSNGIDVSRFAKTDDRLQAARGIRRKLDIPLDAPVVGFVGRLTKDKGIVELAEAFRTVQQSHPGARLLLVGEFESGDPVPQDTIDWLRSNPAVCVAGFSKDPSDFYSVMDLLAFPSYREGFPNVPLEAAAASIPVVGFAATGTVDAVVDGQTGTLVPLGDVAGLSDAIVKYLSNDLLRFRHGQAGFHRTSTEFPNEVIWEAMCNLYTSMLPEDRQPVATPDDSSIKRAA
jgi:glycosyltransferase involved in cell wall biosynthesis